MLELIKHLPDNEQWEKKSASAWPMRVQLSSHNVEYPAYFSILTSHQLLNITHYAKDDATKLALLAAAYDQAHNTFDALDPTIIGRTAAMAGKVAIQLEQPRIEIQNWAYRAIGALNPNEEPDERANILEAIAEVRQDFADYLEPLANSSNI